MSGDETYNGYANRETWAFNLHWQNDQGLYFETLDNARTVAAQTESDYDLGEFVVSYWRDAFDEAPPTEKHQPASFHFNREVGSWWRIDYAEVGAAVRESLEAESD